MRSASSEANEFDIQAPLKRIMGLREVIERRRAEGFAVVLCRENIELKFPLNFPLEIREKLRGDSYKEMREIFADESLVFPDETIRYLEGQLEFIEMSAQKPGAWRNCLERQFRLARRVVGIMQERSLELALGEEMGTAREVEKELGGIVKKAGVFYEDTPDSLVGAVVKVYSLAFAYANAIGKSCIVTPRSHFGRVLEFHRNMTQWQYFYPNIEIYGSRE